MNYIKTIICILLSFTTCSCGYTVYKKNGLNGDINSIYISILKNRSSIVGAETIFTNGLIEEFIRNNVKITNHDTADAVVYGTIVSIAFDALARTSDDIVYKRGVNLVIDIDIKDKKGNIIYSGKGITDSEPYTVTRQNAIDQISIKSALERVSKRLARRVVNQIGDDF